MLENADRQKLFGFFGYLKDATVTNLKMKAAVHNTTDNTVYCYTGGIAGYCNRSVITECSNTGKIEAVMAGSIYTGGIAGFNLVSQIYDCCKNTGSVNQRLPDKGNNYLRVEGNPSSVIPCPNGHPAM